MFSRYGRDLVVSAVLRILEESIPNRATDQPLDTKPFRRGEVHLVEPLSYFLQMQLNASQSDKVFFWKYFLTDFFYFHIFYKLQLLSD